MVFIKLYGADQFPAMDYCHVIEAALEKKVNLGTDIAFICPDSFFVHKGQEQTSFHVLCEVLAPRSLKSKESAIAGILSESLKQLSVHSHIVFSYFDYEKDNIDKDYPVYLTKDNMVKVDSGEEEGEEGEDSENEGGTDIFYGNAFSELDDYVAAHPEMTKDEATLKYYSEKKHKTEQEMAEEEKESGK